MQTSEKTDRVTWQVTHITGVPILGRTQAGIMNYISYLEIYAPQEQEQSPVSHDSLKSTDYIHSLKTMQCSLQCKRLHSLWTVYRPPRSAAAAKAKSSTANEPKSPQVSWCKSSITINGRTHPLATTKEYILHEYADIFKGVGTLSGGPYHIKLKDSYNTHQDQCH